MSSKNFLLILRILGGHRRLLTSLFTWIIHFFTIWTTCLSNSSSCWIIIVRYLKFLPIGTSCLFNLTISLVLVLLYIILHLIYLVLVLLNIKLLICKICFPNLNLELILFKFHQHFLVVKMPFLRNCSIASLTKFVSRERLIQGGASLRHQHLHFVHKSMLLCTSSKRREDEDTLRRI